MISPQLLPVGHADLAPSTRIGDAWAAIAAVDDPELWSTRARMRALLEARPEPLVRTERPGHLTGSALVVHPDLERVLVLLHTKLGIWVQPGGHADGDANLVAVALREAQEETGIDGLRIWPVAVDLDIHRVDPPAEDAHDHHDVRFVALSPVDGVVATNDESRDARWVTAAELPGLGADTGLCRLATTGLRLARAIAPD